MTNHRFTGIFGRINRGLGHTFRKGLVQINVSVILSIGTGIVQYPQQHPQIVAVRMDQTNELALPQWKATGSVGIGFKIVGPVYAGFLQKSVRDRRTVLRAFKPTDGRGGRVQSLAAFTAAGGQTGARRARSQGTGSRQIGLNDVAVLGQ